MTDINKLAQAKEFALSMNFPVYDTAARQPRKLSGQQVFDKFAASAQGIADQAAASALEAQNAIPTVQKVDYTELRAYTGNATVIYVTGYLVSANPSGIAGTFTRDDSDTTSSDNGYSIIVASNGKRWKRVSDSAFLVPATSPRGGLEAMDGRGIFMGADAQLVQGQEYLSAWYKMLQDNHDAYVASSTITNCIGWFVGDSKVAGTGVGTNGNLHLQMIAAAHRAGFTLCNFGQFSQSGENSAYMLSTTVPAMMANANWSKTGVVFLDFGTNERVATASGGPLTLAQTSANMRAIIDMMRNTGAGGRDANSMSIVIMAQTAANNTTAGYSQDENLMRELNTLYREIAAEKQCCFFDALYLARKPHAFADWMDVNAGLGNSNIHPSGRFNAMLLHYLSEVVFPDGLQNLCGFGAGNQYGAFYITATNGFGATADATALPSTYKMGVPTSMRATVANGWPLDGMVITSRYPTKITSQYLWDRSTGAVQFRTSNGSADSWGSWIKVTNEVSNASGSTNPAATDANTTFPTGYSVRRATPANGFPIDGFVETLREDSSNFSRQMLWAYNANVPALQRQWNNESAGWGIWQMVGSGRSRKVIGAAATSYTMGTNVMYARLTNTAAAAFALTLPAPLFDGVEHTVVFVNATGAITYTPTAPATATAGLPGTLAANTPLHIIYDSATATWYPA